ncbi:unnamed protein product [Cuscuta epithymum]|uniref:BTB/POZ domain-containing protein n=1 Tax=Cuscuta epithymum TaxID=186058 RepID=A0AAV0FTZ4_9ASTE|nr:unnamed protein product [Cuscuta epithymum]
MEAKLGFDGLGHVEIIYEEEEDEEDKTKGGSDLSSSTAISAHDSPSSQLPHLSCIKSWCRTTGDETDVVIYVEDSCFHLHKAALTSKSGYLKRHLNKSSELTLSPPLKITAHTFTMLVEFLYGVDLTLTPFNVVSLRTAAELLEITGGREGLVQKTEIYFCRAVTVKPECTLIVLRSALSLLPESETTARLASRSIEALCVMDNGVTSCMDDVKELAPKDFIVILESMNRRFCSSHDLLYKLVDLYLKEHNGKMTDEEQLRICNNIDCSLLSPKLLMHAVQNPKMPLRFAVQAMFVQQLNTRSSIVSAAARPLHKTTNNNDNNNHSAMTLGAILERDAVFRQAADLKESMDATSSRIQSLEKELSEMRELLKRQPIRKGERGSVSSGSFRLYSERKDGKGEKGGGVYSSSSSFRVVSGSSSSEWSSQDGSPMVGKGYLPRRFIKGLISTFKVSKNQPAGTLGKLGMPKKSVMTTGTTS